MGNTDIGAWIGSGEAKCNASPTVRATLDGYPVRTVDYALWVGKNVRYWLAIGTVIAVIGGTFALRAIRVVPNFDCGKEWCRFDAPYFLPPFKAKLFSATGTEQRCWGRETEIDETVVYMWREPRDLSESQLQKVTTEFFKSKLLNDSLSMRGAVGQSASNAVALIATTKSSEGRVWGVMCIAKTHLKEVLVLYSAWDAGNQSHQDQSFDMQRSLLKDTEFKRTFKFSNIEQL